MSAATLPAHDRAAIEAKGRRIAAALTTAALDPETRLPMADRMALAALALAVEVEIAHRTGAIPPAAHLPQLAATLSAVERDTALRA